MPDDALEFFVKVLFGVALVLFIIPLAVVLLWVITHTLLAGGATLYTALSGVPMTVPQFAVVLAKFGSKGLLVSFGVLVLLGLSSRLRWK